MTSLGKLWESPDFSSSRGKLSVVKKVIDPLRTFSIRSKWHHGKNVVMEIFCRAARIECLDYDLEANIYEKIPEIN